jgi:hypothetical protein
MTRGEVVRRLDAIAYLIDEVERSLERGDPMKQVGRALGRYLDRFAEAEP